MTIFSFVFFSHQSFALEQQLIEEYKKQIFELKQIASENEKNKNLLQGYKKVIEDLSAKLSQKDS